MNVAQLMNASQQRPALRFDPKMVRVSEQPAPVRQNSNGFNNSSLWLLGTSFAITHDQFLNSSSYLFDDD